MDNYEITLISNLKLLESAIKQSEAAVDKINVLQETCRVCLIRTADNNLEDNLVLNAEYKHLESMENLLTIRRVLELSTGLGISPDHDFMPSQICNKCLGNLNSCYSFRLQAQNADKILKCFLAKNNTTKHQPPLTSNETVAPSLPSSSCNATFSGKTDLVRSNNIEASSVQVFENEQIECKYCLEKFKFNNELDSHMNVCHLGLKQLSCKVCSKTFRNPKTLKRHVKISCVSLELVEQCKRRDLKSGIPLQRAIDACELAIQAAGFSCCLCDKSFKTEFEYISHMPEHADKKNCHICNQAFGRSLYLENHLKKHLRQIPYKCPFCRRAFCSMTSVRNHVKEHSNRAKYVCNLCGKVFRVLRKFIPHMKKHELENGSKLDSCDARDKEIKEGNSNEEIEMDQQETASNVIEERPTNAQFEIETLCTEELQIKVEQNEFDDSNMEEQANNVKADDNFTSGDAPYQFYEIKQEIIENEITDQLSSHKANQEATFEITELPDIHEIQQASYGSIRQQDFTMKIEKETPDLDLMNMTVDQQLPNNDDASSANLNKQTKVTTADNQPPAYAAFRTFICQIPDCRKEFYYGPDIANHYMTQHCPSKRPFICPICPSEEFPKKRNIRKHLNSSHIDNRYKCTICSKKCNLLRQMQDHMLFHTKDRPFPCTICDSKFKNDNALRVHMITHDKTKRFHCSVCSKAFYSYNGLYLHSKLHSVHKELQCTLCGRQCSTKFRLQRHMNNCERKTGVAKDCDTAEEATESKSKE